MNLSCVRQEEKSTKNISVIHMYIFKHVKLRKKYS